MVTAPLCARSHAEADLYIELHPCRCGERDLPRRSVLVARSGDLLTVHTGQCPRCGSERTFEFSLPEELPVPGDRPTYGGTAPSCIVDAGQYMALAEHMAVSVVADPASIAADDRAGIRHRIGVATSALEEVIKFIPAGADRVPPGACFTPGGRAMYDLEPGRFRRARLAAVLTTYRRILAEHGDVS